MWFYAVLVLVQMGFAILVLIAQTTAPFAWRPSNVVELIAGLMWVGGVLSIGLIVVEDRLSKMLAEMKRKDGPLG